MPRREVRPRRVRIVRYLDAQDRRVPKGTPGARAMRVLSETWYATLVIDGRRRTVSLGTTDEGEAWTELRRIQREGGTLPAPKTPAATFAEHAADWRDAMLAGGSAPEWVATLHSRVVALAEMAKWSRLADVTADGAKAALAKLLNPPLSLSPATRNHYLSHLRQFLRWCLQPPARISAYPIAGLKPIGIEHDVRRKRRVPTGEEVLKLFTYLEGDAPVRHGMSARQRLLGYKTAMACGLRMGELRTLTADSFDLSGGMVAIHAAYDKAGRAVLQPLPPWLVNDLREWFAGDGGCWPFPRFHATRIFRADLDGAGVLYAVTDRDGKTPLYFDLHALRVYYITELANQPDITIKTLMTLARHSTPTLTLKTYAKAKDEALRAAVNQLPDPGCAPGTLGCAGRQDKAGQPETTGDKNPGAGKKAKGRGKSKGK